ncbi:MAG: carboxypeptidase regulatory-like domain-containing protein [Blastocatellia bacterium]|nr:carboxypeptidase regulatory-like domain-containing protein [Blastocatellia bacterium]
MTKKLTATFSLLFLLINTGPLSAPCLAQGAIELYGSVVDETRAFIVAAPVALDDGKGNKYTTQTDGQGRYRFTNVKPGLYRLLIVVEGFAPFEEQIDLTAERTAPFDVTLKVFISEQVEVKTEDAGLSTEPDNNLSAIVLTEEDLEALPDDPDELLETLRLIAGGAGGGDEAALYVDGFSEDGRIPPKEAILRIQLNSNPFSAEYNEPGRSRIEIITKPGSDAYHGGFRLNFNDEAMNARNAFAPFRAPLQTRSYNGNLSGPIIKNRWGFFVDMNRREQDENGVVNATVLNPVTFLPEPFAETVLTPSRVTNFSIRTDFLVTPKHTLWFQYRRTSRANENQGLGGGFDLPERASTRTRGDNTFRFSLTSIVSERAVNEFRLEFDRDTSATQAVTDATAIIVLDAFSAGGNQGSLFSEDEEDEIELVNNLTYTYNKHTFRVGVRAERESGNILNRSNFGGTFTFGTDVERDALGVPVLNQVGNQIPISPLELYRRVITGVEGYRPSQFSIVRGDPSLNISQLEMGWFIQDDWRIRPSLTLSYGLRHSWQTNLEDDLNFAPRAGLAWQPDKEGLSTVRLGAGIFHDFISDGITLDTIRLDGERQQQFTVQRPSFFPDIPDLLEGAVQRPSTVRVKDDHLNAPYSIISTASYERRLPNDIFASVGYTWTRGVHLLRTRNLNAPLPNGGSIDPVLPFPDRGPILVYESTGFLTRHEMTLSLRTEIGPLQLSGNYTLSSTRSDTDGSGQTPANSFDLGPEWGRSGQDSRHNVFVRGSISLPWRVRLSSFVRANSGRPFNITTGRDNNRDTLFSDRPAFASPDDPEAVITEFGVFNPNPLLGDEIIPRNFGQGPGSVNVSLSVSKTFGFGESRSARASRGVTEDGRQADLERVRRERRDGGWRGGGRGGRGRGGTGGRGGDGDRGRQKYNLTISLNARNLFNTTNLSRYNGVLTSARFGTANSAQQSRRIEASLNFRF